MKTDAEPPFPFYSLLKVEVDFPHVILLDVLLGDLRHTSLGKACGNLEDGQLIRKCSGSAMIWG